ncbi:hypothetical protein GDO86_005539 [Hymenochirus boettgeri]|uniref:Uncharacterized protein n=1 Tax=Hymenochirus boettgeri TaxID=247094 RepID=A0A8T2JA95_9PIPI|nr:hypothetical protein GDO86_005539 [Hymenochirus boettgeri]
MLVDRASWYLRALQGRCWLLASPGRWEGSSLRME